MEPTVWAQGDIQSFRGTPAEDQGNEGDLRTGYVGTDARLGERLLAGVAVGRSGGGGNLPPAKRHLAVYTSAAPHGPLDLVAPLRPAQDFPIRLHHRLQDLHPGRDAQAMERFPDTVTTPSTGNGT